METKESDLLWKYENKILSLYSKPETVNVLLEEVFENEEYDNIIKIIFRILSKYPFITRYINFNNIDYKIIEEIIKFNPDALMYVPKQPEDLCMLALETCNKAKGRLYKPESLFRYVIKPQYQTDKICLQAPPFNLTLLTLGACIAFFKLGILSSMYKKSFLYA